MRMLALIHELAEKNSQFIISTHSPILPAYPDAAFYELTEEDIRRVTYREAAHYQPTKRFLDDPERMLSYLFEEEENS